MKNIDSYEKIVAFISQTELTPLMLVKAHQLYVYKRVRVSRLQKAQLNSEIIKKLTNMDASYDEWEAAFNEMNPYIPPDSIKHLLAKKMVGKATKFIHWKEMVKRCATFGKYSKTVLSQMCATASTIEECTFVYDSSPNNSDQLAAIGKILDLIVDFESWHKAFQLSSAESLLREKVIEKYGDFPVSFSQIWIAFRRYSKKRKELQHILAEKISQMNLSADEWCIVFQKTPSEYPLKEIALKKINETEAV